jgi:hypothetical protein|tara:strand:+ start:12672 stop:12839 length:168 start_codon:yes stop_codon:yes gene_type:complete
MVIKRFVKTSTAVTLGGVVMNQAAAMPHFGGATQSLVGVGVLSHAADGLIKKKKK